MSRMSRSESECLAETVEKQNTIIKMQSGIIDNLFILLLQHISVEQAEMRTCIKMIDEAALLRRSMEPNETRA